jgi:cytochrome bd-type quinol oxidase subunit 2
MRARSWAIVGSLVINLMLGLAIAAVFSGSPTAAAADLARCPGHTVTHSAPAAPQPARPGHRYIVAVRMGWAM